ncbi:MAG: hypothetical protein D6800_06800 [Candidatus Zixiibacteriota bacterium]|nr:MAG: hypothetical protein D6800_06800 [candidate division Zixibacteria bacterium]
MAETYLYINGQAPSAQQRSELDKIQSVASQFVTASRQVTRSVQDLLETVLALQDEYGPIIGGADPETRLTVSPDSKKVKHLRNVLRASLSYAVVVGTVDAGTANSIISLWYGEPMTVVDATQIKSLLDVWR